MGRLILGRLGDKKHTGEFQLPIGFIGGQI
jgi:hypothetical protein